MLTQLDVFAATGSGSTGRSPSLLSNPMLLKEFLNARIVVHLQKQSSSPWSMSLDKVKQIVGIGCT
jgi:hypothetical protein